MLFPKFGAFCVHARNTAWAFLRSDVLGIFRVGFDEFPDVLRGRADTAIGQMLRDLARTLTAVPGFQDLIPERHQDAAAFAVLFARVGTA